MKTVFCAGSINYDIFFKSSRMPEAHEKLRCSESWQECGGSAANTAFWLARLGIPTLIVGRCGRDSLAAACLKSLQEAGVVTELVQQDGSLPTGTAVVITDGTEKRMLTGRNANHAFIVEPTILERFDANSHLHISLTDDHIAMQLLEAAKSRGASTSCDFNGSQQRERIPLCDYCFMNTDELRRWGGDGDFQEVWRGLCGDTDSLLVLTQAAEGAFAISQHQVVARPTIAVNPIDRTGGGDAFNAGFLAAIVQEEELVDAIDIGLQLARQVIQQRGSRPNLGAGDNSV